MSGGAVGAWRESAAAAARGVVTGALLYLAADSASDAYVAATLRSQALELAAGDAALLETLGGGPLAAAPWYAGTLGYSHRDRVAHATFAVTGAAASRATDVVARGARRPDGPRSNVLYNLVGPRAWELVGCAAMAPAPGGLARPHDLMPRAAPHGVVGLEECLPCKEQQQQAAAGGEDAARRRGATQGAGAAPPKRRWWRFWAHGEPAPAPEQQPRPLQNKRV